MMMGLTSVTRRRRKSFIVPKRQHEEDDEIVSPRRTRSGKVYDQGSCTKKSIIVAPKPVFGVMDVEEEDAPSRLNPMMNNNFSTPKPSPKKRLDYEDDIMENDLLMRMAGRSGGRNSVLILLPSDEEDNGESHTSSSRTSIPPKLNYSRKSMPRVRPFGDEEEPSSPPTQGVMSLNLFDSPAPSTPSLTSLTRRLQSGSLKPNVLFSHRKARTEPRKSVIYDSKVNRANLNPFTPEALLISHQKRNRFRMNYKSHGGSFSELQKSLDQISDLSDDNDSSLSEFQPPHAKRIRVSDIHISRYNKEFVELQSLASGEYGSVKVARHRLDGMVYAIKVTKKVIQPCSHEEHVAMNEVFAHAAMMKHKHVIRYFNSWVENCQVYIQTEYCEGGSLQSQINSYRKRNRRFPESELRTVLTQIAKGLHYIHSKDLVHMDIKPENIFIAIEHPSSPSTSPGGSIVADAPARNSGNESTDSGNHSGNDAVNTLRGNLRGTERLTYKIGDLGNIAQIHGDFIPEEGDCRYMAPELFAIHVDRSKLSKADVFSLGLSIYATASLEDIPKNSMDDPIMYDRIKSGDLPYLDNYSKEFNQVLRSMVSPDPAARPSPSKLMTIFLNNSNYAVKSRSQLCKELKDSEARIRQLEELLTQRQAAVSNSFSIMDNSISSSISSSSNNQSSTTPTSSKVTSTPNMLSKTSSRAVGKGTIKSSSCIL